MFFYINARRHTILFNYFHQASKEKVLIMGDFNFAGIDWNKPELDDLDYFMKCVNDNLLI